MSADFNGTEFVGIDEDAVAENQPLDTFVENAIRSNLAAIQALGQQVSWAPRTFKAGDHNRKTGIRPYASFDKSTILSVPWIVQPGDDAIHLSIHHRCDDEHGLGFSCYGYAYLADVTDPIPRFVISNTSASTPQWQMYEHSFSLNEPATIERFTDLRVEQSGLCGFNVIQASGVRYVVSRAGSRVRRNSGTGAALLQQTASSYPDSGDRHVLIWDNIFEETDEQFDILWASPADDDAITRPSVDGRPNFNESFESRTRALGYLQVRGIEIRQTISPGHDLRAKERYTPHLLVDARDEIAHPFSMNKLRARKRCLWIGPTGGNNDPEVWPEDGYGERFNRVTGSTTPQQALTATIVPKTKGPKILVLANILGSWDTSLFGDLRNITKFDALTSASGEVDWHFDVAIKRFELGTTTPDEVATEDITIPIIQWPQTSSIVSPALTSEAILTDRLIGGPFKEGQLFDEDHALLSRIAIEIDLSDHDPATNLDPYILTLSASVSSMARFAPNAAQDTSGLDEEDLRLTFTGVSIWEVPQEINL